MNPRSAMQASKSFVPPFELMGSRPRDVQLTASGRVVYGLAIAMMAGALVVAILLSGVSAQQRQRRDAFNRDGVSATAQVTRVWRESGGESKKNWIAYSFMAEGFPTEGQSRVGSSRWKSLHVGSPVEIRYLPSDPQGAVLAGSGPDVLPMPVPFLVAGLMMLASALMIRGVNCQRRLLADGRPAPAVITDIVKHNTSHGGAHRHLKYTFPLMSGATATGKSEAPKKPPAIGSVICVVYDPDRPRRNRRYPFPLVKTARL